ncbi:hypothetical protein [Blastococcus sp. SYSU DS1024]
MTTPQPASATRAPGTFAAARAQLTAAGLGVEDWDARFPGYQQWPIERAVTDAVAALTARDRDPELRKLVIRAVLAARPALAEELLARFGPLHATPAALLCADVGWADDTLVVRAELEGKSRGAAGNWVDLAGVLTRIAAGQLNWRTDPHAAAFAAGVPAYLAQWPNVSQAEFPCWTPRAWADAGYRIDPAAGTALVLWTAAPRRGPQETWKDAEHAARWVTTRWLPTFGYLLTALTTGGLPAALTAADRRALEELTQMIGSA